MLRAQPQRVGIMGGMFDPVHKGHLQLAQNVRACCGLDQLRLVPCGTPVHRSGAVAAAALRIRMLELAVENSDWLQVDARECLRAEPSYTYDTLAEIRTEVPQAMLFLVMGLDAFLALATWYRWQELFDLAHLVVASRPGYELATAALDASLRAEVGERCTSSMAVVEQSAAGRILLANLPTPAISSTQVRTMLQSGMNTADVLHPAVSGFIRANRLYQ